MVASLDEIVWAVNPANDSLPHLATYFCQFAEEFLRPTSIRCRLDVADSLPMLPLTSEVRHNLYLAVREALNNVVKHSRATEVWLRIHSEEGALRIALEDNGCGFEAGSAAETGEGLANLRRRLEKIGGHFEYDSKPGAGTTCRIWLPLLAGVKRET
jgi:signal transduction histidine kinase